VFQRDASAFQRGKHRRLRVEKSILKDFSIGVSAQPASVFQRGKTEGFAIGVSAWKPGVAVRGTGTCRGAFRKNVGKLRQVLDSDKPVGYVERHSGVLAGELGGADRVCVGIADMSTNRRLLQHL